MSGSSDEGADRRRDKLSDGQVEKGEEALTDEGEVMETDGETRVEGTKV